VNRLLKAFFLWFYRLINEKMKIVGIVEARMSSTRLPGKVLLPFGGTPALELLLKRIRSARYLDEIVVATTDQESDLPIVDLCQKIGVRSFRGSENDVMKRVLDAARHCEADLICELMGDSPFLDRDEIDRAISEHQARDCDYLSNFWPQNTYPLGFAVQVYPTEVLSRAEKMTQDPVDRSHVTTFIYQNQDLFKLEGINATTECHAPDLRMALDQSEDYEAMQAVFDGVKGRENPLFSMRDCVRFLRNNPRVAKINQDVRVKKIEER
jgi:spore coat polysaccharide biosynthesis protein SpsF